MVMYKESPLYVTEYEDIDSLSSRQAVPIPTSSVEDPIVTSHAATNENIANDIQEMSVTENVPSETGQGNRLVGRETAGYSDFASLRLRLAAINSSDGDHENRAASVLPENNVHGGTANDTTPLGTLPTEEIARPTYQREYANLPSLCPVTNIDLKGVTPAENATRESNQLVSDTTPITTSEVGYSDFSSLRSRLALQVRCSVEDSKNSIPLADIATAARETTVSEKIAPTDEIDLHASECESSQ